MSISSVKNFMDRSGCAIIIAVSMAIVFAGGLAVYWFQGQGARAEQAAVPTASIATLGTTPVSADAVENAFRTNQALMSQRLGNAPDFEGFPPEQEGRFFAESLKQVVNSAITAELAKQNGVVMTDEEAKKVLEAEIDKELQGLRAQLVTLGKLKEGASEADFAAAFKKETQQDLATVRSQQLAEATKMLADPNQRAGILSAITQMALVRRFEAMAQVTDEDLKRATEVYTIQRVFVPGSGDEARATIEKAEAAIKSGQPFGDVVAQFSKDLPEPGKTLRESRQSLPYTVIVSNPGLESVKDLKAGQTSGILELPNGLVIIRVVEVKGEAPKDLATNRDTYLKPMVQAMATARLTKESEALRSSKLTWKSPGYESLYRVAQLLDRGGVSPDRAMRPEFEAVLKDAQAAGTSDNLGSRAAAYAAYLASNALWPMLSPAERTEQAEGRIEVLRNILQSTESPILRLELAELLITLKSPEAVAELLQAATNNASFGPQGQQVNNQISSVLRKLTVAKLATPEDAKSVEAEQQRWIRERRENDRMIAEARAQEAKERAEAEAAAKAEEAAAKKAEAEAKQSAPAATPQARETAPLGGN